MKIRYRYLLVDNDRTLMDFDAAERWALTCTLERADIVLDEDIFGQYARVNSAMWSAFERGEVWFERVQIEPFNQLLRFLGKSGRATETMARDYAHFLSRHAVLLDGARELLGAVRPHMKIALVSNANAAVQRKRLSRSGLMAMLDAVVLSDEAGFCKPDVRIVFAALDALGCRDPKEAVFLGDSLSCDVAAARAAGMDSIWLNTKCETSALPTYEVHTLKQARRILLKPYEE